MSHHDSSSGEESSSGGRQHAVLIELKSCAAEFIATLVFVFIGTAVCDTQDSLQIAAAHGLAIAMLVDQFVDISGAHINPAVTVGVMLGNGSIHWLQAAFYILAQLSGAVAGASLTRMVLSFPSSSSPEKTHYDSIHGGCTTLGKQVHPMQAIACEAIITFILVQTVLLLVTNKTITKHHASLAIGFAVFVGISAGFGVTGGSMNPARSFGPAMLYLDRGGSALRDHYVYWVGPMTGSLIAVFFFRLIFGDLNQTIWGKLFGARVGSHVVGLEGRH